jgi:hypothetical protein
MTEPLDELCAQAIEKFDGKVCMHLDTDTLCIQYVPMHVVTITLYILYMYICMHVATVQYISGKYYQMTR